MSRSVHIAALGARTAIGLTAEASAAAVRAQISRIAEHPSIVDRRGEPIRGCLDARLGLNLSGCARLLALAEAPLRMLLSKLVSLEAWRAPIPLFLGVPESRPGWTDTDTQQFAQALARLEFPNVSKLQVAAVESGHAGTLHALALATQQITHRITDLCLVGGVDSYFDLRTLDWLDGNRQLAGQGSRSGFFPGEGAGFVVLASSDALRGLQLPSLATVRGCHSARESRLIKADLDCVGEGLTSAINGAVADLHPLDEKIDNIFCDINGERYRSEEWGFALLRTQRVFRDGTRYVAPASCWGDIGAASGALLSILAVRSWERNYARGPLALVWGSSEKGLRSAVVLQQPGSR